MAYYGTPEDGDVYFAQLYGRREWKDALTADKRAALFEATQSIDRFNYLGSKTSTTQELQFPRGGDTTVPKDIEYATYEEAYQILKGGDVEDELQKIRVQQEKFGQVQTQYFPGTKPSENVTAGILSSKAWRLIVKYFRPANQIQIVRV